MFAVVKFIGGDKVAAAVAPLKWIKLNRCLWPLEHLRNRNNLERDIAPSDTWESYCVKTLRIFGN